MHNALSTLTLQQINIFLTVVDANGFARAGEVLHMTQPAVSKSIAKMEKNLNLRLFTRTTRSHALTEAGQMLYDAWKPLIGQMDRSYLQTCRLLEANNHTLSLGVLSTARPDLYFHPLIRRMQELHPEIHLTYEFDYMTNLERDLASAQKYDLILIPDFERFYINTLHLPYRYAAFDHMYLLLSKTHPLAAKTSVTTPDFADEPMVQIITHEDGQYYLQDLTERLARFRKTPQISYTFRNAYDIRYLFTSSHAILLADNYFDYSADQMDMVKLRIEDQFGGIICVWDPENRKQSLQYFLDLLPDLPSENKNAPAEAE
jgi:DNA-binding transcriptional LysR family regulator